MTVVIEVDYAVLERAAADWGVAADDLQDAQARLALVSGAGLAPLVGAEVDAFARSWRREVRALGERARCGRGALALAAGDFRIADRRQAEQIRSLMPWGQRHDRIREL